MSSALYAPPPSTGALIVAWPTFALKNDWLLFFIFRKDREGKRGKGKGRKIEGKEREKEKERERLGKDEKLQALAFFPPYFLTRTPQSMNMQIRNTPPTYKPHPFPLYTDVAWPTHHDNDILFSERRGKRVKRKRKEEK